MVWKRDQLKECKMCLCHCNFVTTFCVNMGTYSRYSRANIGGHWCVSSLIPDNRGRGNTFIRPSVCPSVPSVCTKAEISAAQVDQQSE